jgi:hypothetical protein
MTGEDRKLCVRSSYSDQQSVLIREIVIVISYELHVFKKSNYQFKPRV